MKFIKCELGQKGYEWFLEHGGGKKERASAVEILDCGKLVREINFRVLF